VPGGLVFGPFRILDQLGSGATGKVYRAVDRRTGLERALKVLPPSNAEERVVQRFRREMFLAQLLDHPQIARCHEVGRQDGIYYLVFDLLAGRPLQEVVEVEGPLAPARAARVFAGFAAGLAHAHQRGLVHRDVSSTNLIVGDQAQGWLVDFGLALLGGEASEGGGTKESDVPLGTPGYIAPEQCRNHHSVDGRADIYSLGCCLHLALTGQPLFPGHDTNSRMEAQRAEPQPRLDHLHIPALLVAQLRRCLQLDPAARPDASEAQMHLLSCARILGND